jgi:hypothetical protein
VRDEKSVTSAAKLKSELRTEESSSTLKTEAHFLAEWRRSVETLLYASIDCLRDVNLRLTKVASGIYVHGTRKKGKTVHTGSTTRRRIAVAGN